MKRLLSWILVLTMLLSLTACGKKEPEGGQTVSMEQQKEVLTETIAKTGTFLHSSVAEPTFGTVGGEWLVLGLARSGLEISDEYFEAYFQNVSAYTAQQGGVLHTCTSGEIDFSKRCIYRIEEFTSYNENPIGYFEAHREDWQDSVLILQDIFCGVVPMGAENRVWRQRTGRLAQYLSKEARQVSRIFCGLEQRLK